MKEKSEFVEKLVAINRITKVVKGGRRFGFAALVVAGNQKGSIGIGQGKSKQVPDAIKKATEVAKRNMVKIPLKDGRTLHHDVFAKSGSGKILITSNIKVLKEILKNNYNCIIIKNYKSVNSWKKQIDQINLNKYKYLNIRLNALQTAKKYTWENRANQMLKNIQ